jgi:hypothetical protein
MTTKKGKPILFGDDGEKGEVHGQMQVLRLRCSQKRTSFAQDDSR